MRRMVLVLALSLIVGLTLVPRGAWAHDRHHGVDAGCCVFIAPGHPFVIHRFHGQSRFFIHHGFVHPHPSSVIVVPSAPEPVWVPGFWWWNGLQWLWVPGQWAVPGS